jgi:hypothetical protein
MKDIKYIPNPIIAFAMLVILVVGWAPKGFSQTRTENTEKKAHYVIVSTGEVSDISFYTRVLDNTNFDKFRLIEGRRTIRFDSGFTIELLSGKELYDKYGKRINYDVIQKWGDTPEYPHVFSITPEGHLMKQMEVQPAKMQVKGQ